MNKSIIAIISALMMVACDDGSRSNLRTNPSIINMGIIDGCSVKFVDRGSNIESFFIARCGTTGTTTRNYKVSHGKTSSDERVTVITDEIDKLTTEKTLITQTEVALSKLTVEERKLFEQK